MIRNLQCVCLRGTRASVSKQGVGCAVVVYRQAPVGRQCTTLVVCPTLPDCQWHRLTRDLPTPPAEHWCPHLSTHRHHPTPHHPALPRMERLQQPLLLTTNYYDTQMQHVHHARMERSRDRLCLMLALVTLHVHSGEHNSTEQSSHDGEQQEGQVSSEARRQATASTRTYTTQCTMGPVPRHWHCVGLPGPGSVCVR